MPGFNFLKKISGGLRRSNQDFRCPEPAVVDTTYEQDITGQLGTLVEMHPESTMEGIQVITIEPKAPHTHTVVFLHGRGDNARNFSFAVGRWQDSQGRNLAAAFPSFRFVFPQAPMRKCAATADGPTWPQWFDVWNTRDFTDHEELQAEGLREMVPVIRRILAAEAASLGSETLPSWGKVILAGISMGGATSVHTLFNLDAPRLGAFMGFSCRLPFPRCQAVLELREVLKLDEVPRDGGQSQVLANTPILLEHCVDDPLVLVEGGRGLRDKLRALGAQNVEWKEYPAGGHWFNSPHGMDDAVEFINRHLLGEGQQQAQGEDAMDQS
jgi:predicted esterase